MLDPVELNAYPSCCSCISWSADGELAITAGDSVYVLSPKLPSVQAESQNVPLTSSRLNAQWNVTKVRTNAFTQEEWPLMFPLAGDSFSVGEEQSLSHVTAASWSAPGLATYRRCMLAVLTSNLLLSLWEATDGAEKWARVGIVNGKLEEYFKASAGEDVELLKRKQRVRSFAWSAPCNRADGVVMRQQSGFAVGPRRWGVHLLAVANDVGDIVLLRIRSGRGRDPGCWIEVVSHYSLVVSRGCFPRIDPNSLFAISLHGREIVKRMAWSFWNTTSSSVEELEEKSTSLFSTLALNYGSELRLLRLQAYFKFDEDTGWDLRDTQVIEIGLQSSLDVERPIARGLVVGIFGGILTVAFEDSIENVGLEQRSLKTVLCQRYLGSDNPDATAPTDWSPVSGIISTFDVDLKAPVIRAASLLSSADCHILPTNKQGNEAATGDANQPSNSEWQRQMEHFRSRFDLDQDLGGMSATRIWGLDTYRGWLAACFTIHPTDMAEHLTPSHERLRVVFAPLRDELRDHTRLGMPWHRPVLNHNDVENARQVVLQYILDEEHRRLSDDPWLKRIVYVASCCVITQSKYDVELAHRAKLALSWLHECTGLDFTEETSSLDDAQDFNTKNAPPRRISATPTEETNRFASDVFEKCEICGARMEWCSATESQCVEGHLFGTLGLPSWALRTIFIANLHVLVLFCSSLWRVSPIDPGSIHFESLQRVWEGISGLCKPAGEAPNIRRQRTKGIAGKGAGDI
ncbi:hypothetical protein PRK78_007537 [Emydomyces testavorans]|uniref:Transcription factor IIIC 90kDa subunit N-terminal domain-containing protein n=1 Tax=Emydomyces testavorans TaxID=2070801 RepID=A0AAF0IMT6_9EURO|nr:hypothetical protein PRK78_007537 [Emydomyces testavorans]